MCLHQESIGEPIDIYVVDTRQLGKRNVNNGTHDLFWNGMCTLQKPIAFESVSVILGERSVCVFVLVHSKDFFALCERCASSSQWMLEDTDNTDPVSSTAIQ